MSLRALKLSETTNQPSTLGVCTNNFAMSLDYLGRC